MNGRSLCVPGRFNEVGVAFGEPESVGEIRATILSRAGSSSLAVRRGHSRWRRPANGRLEERGWVEV